MKAKWVRHRNEKTGEVWETCTHCDEKRPIDYDAYRDGAFAFADCPFCPICGSEMEEDYETELIEDD